jgi:glycosyltransferase involved in cell wall biosynthesis
MVTGDQNRIIKLLPVAIMAHNEEKVIQKAIESILTQRVPEGYSVKVVIVTNGCTDRTEEIIRELEMKNMGKIELLPINEKGKSRAINHAINFFNNISTTRFTIPYVIFLDADCEFVGDNVLINFVEHLEQNPELCAVAADCLPDSLFNSRKDIVAEMYRAIYELRRSIMINSISGMCYGIRFEILKKIHFPDFQLAEDMYLSALLDGRFLRDKKIRIVFMTPFSLHDEVKRRTRQEVSTQRYRRYYSYLKNKGKSVKLFNEALGNQYRWGGSPDYEIIKALHELKGFKFKLLFTLSYLIRVYCKIKSSFMLRRIKKNHDLDYWRVIR